MLALTTSRAWSDVTGPVDGSLSCAVAPVVARRRVVAQALCELHSASTCSRACAPRPPGAPATVVRGLRIDKNRRKGSN